MGCDPVESNYILYLGRIDIHHKGLDTLLKAYRDFCDAFPLIKLVIAGDGRDREKFMGMFRGLPPRARENIELKGWVEGKTKRELLQNALMVVVPSRYETQAIVALEAMACAKPVIASDIDELRYIAENGAGIPFREGDATALAQSMEAVLRMGNRSEVGQRGRDWVRNFTWDKMAVRYEEYLERTAGSVRSP